MYKTGKIDTLTGKIDTLRHLEYLDLRVYPEKKYKTLKDGTLIRCNFDKGDHILHSKDKQYNTIVDLVINLSNKLQDQDKIILSLLESIENTQKDYRYKIQKIEENLDYIKNIKSAKTINNLKEGVNPLISDIKEIKDLVLEIKAITLS